MSGNKVLILACMISGFGSGLYARAGALQAAAPQAPAAQAGAPVDTTVCDVVKKPQAFNGQIVRIKGTVVAGFDEFVIKDSTDSNCGYPVNAIWLAYPPGTKGKAGPAAMLTIQPAKNFTGQISPPARAPVTLDKSKDFKEFDSLLAQKHEKGTDICLGCTRYEVTATLVGRLDSVADATLQRDASGKITGFGGFGNMNAYPARLVLQSVADVTPKEVDYSKSEKETAGIPADMGGGYAIDLYNAIAAVQQNADKISAGPTKDAVQKAAAVYGKDGHAAGVSVAYGTANEASPKDEDLGTKDSPDGVLFNCTFNSDRLGANTLARAVIHMGEHVSELRSPAAGNEAAPAYALESDAWVVTAISAVISGQKFLSLPGGYVIWDANWPAAERNDNMTNTLKDFLLNEAMLSR
jgi:hypothetical protein